MSKQLETIFQTMEKSKQVKIEAIMQETQDTIEQIYRDAAKQVEQAEEQFRIDRITQLLSDFRRQLAQRKKAWYTRYNEKRVALVNDVFGAVRQKIQELQQTPEYKEVLQALIRESTEYFETNHRIHGRAADENIFKELELPKNSKLVLDMEDSGIRIDLPERGLSIENTLESRLKQQSELTIEVATILFEKREAEPWEVPQVMATLMRESME